MESEENKQFSQAAHPLNWYEVAKLMHENAQALHGMPQGTVTYNDGVKSITRPTSNRSVFLLAAFALENLIKAYLIYENPNYIEGGKLANQLLNGHSLSKLQKRCKKIPSPKRTLHVFETLEVGVNSWARYPCATSIQRETDERTVTPEFWKCYNDVFELYSKKLEQLLSKKWKGPYGEVTSVQFN
tara:strand:+ start:5550 stop:6107 length:558 start_codon:yes stop_codon:yes gene_type:complete